MTLYSRDGSTPRIKFTFMLGRTQRGEGAAGLQPPPLQTKLKKKTDFVNMVISNVSFDLPYSQNQPLKSGDD